MYAAIVLGFDNKTHLRSSFFATLDKAIEYSNQYLGIVAIENLNTGEFIERNDDTGEFNHE